MKTKLCVAAVAAVLLAPLAAAPAALAQGYQNDASKAPASNSSTSSGRTDSPAVRSLPGVDPDPWRRDASGNFKHVPDDGALQQRAAPNAVSGSTGGTIIDRDASGSSNRGVAKNGATTGNTTIGGVTASDIASRRGRGQNDLELSQTSVLNQFSAAGYTTVRDFHKEGDRYVAQAQDPSGRWANVQLDPHSGTVTPR